MQNFTSKKILDNLVIPLLPLWDYICKPHHRLEKADKSARVSREEVSTKKNSVSREQAVSKGIETSGPNEKERAQNIGLPLKSSSLHDSGTKEYTEGQVSANKAGSLTAHEKFHSQPSQTETSNSPEKKASFPKLQFSERSSPPAEAVKLTRQSAAPELTHQQNVNTSIDTAISHAMAGASTEKELQPTCKGDASSPKLQSSERSSELAEAVELTRQSAAPELTHQQNVNTSTDTANSQAMTMAGASLEEEPQLSRKVNVSPKRLQPSERSSTPAEAVELTRQSAAPELTHQHNVNTSIDTAISQAMAMAGASAKKEVQSEYNRNEIVARNAAEPVEIRENPHHTKRPLVAKNPRNSTGAELTAEKVNSQRIKLSPKTKSSSRRFLTQTVMESKAADPVSATSKASQGNPEKTASASRKKKRDSPDSDLSKEESSLPKVAAKKSQYSKRYRLTSPKQQKPTESAREKKQEKSRQKIQAKQGNVSATPLVKQQSNSISNPPSIVQTASQNFQDDAFINSLIDKSSASVASARTNESPQSAKPAPEQASLTSQTEAALLSKKPERPVQSVFPSHLNSPVAAHFQHWGQKSYEGNFDSKPVKRQKVRKQQPPPAQLSPSEELYESLVRAQFNGLEC